MRLFVHLLGFNTCATEPLQAIRYLVKGKNQATNPIVRFSLGKISISDELIDFLTSKIGFKESQLTIKLIVKHQNQYRKLVLLKGFKFEVYARLDEDIKSLQKYQLEIQVSLLLHAKTDKEQLKDTNSSSATVQSMKISEGNQEDEIIRTNILLFELLQLDELGEFTNTLKISKKKYIPSQLKILLNLFHEETGFNLLQLSIHLHKSQFLDHLIKQYADFIDFNQKSIDGWLPVQLALLNTDKNAISLFLANSDKINLDFNCISQKGQAIYNLIDTADTNLIERIVKKYPIRFQDKHPMLKINAYDYVWRHKLFHEADKKPLISLMHQRHLEEYDFYREDQLLYQSCKKYVPEASRQPSPKKQIIYNPNLKIISGETIRFKKMATLSKYAFISVNSYIGAIEEYQINHRLKLTNDKQKLELYKIGMHISFEEIETVKVLDHKDKSWLARKQWFCFVIVDKRKNKVTYACNHQYTATQWVQQIEQSIQAWRKNEEKHHKMCKNYIHISDVEYSPPQPQPMKKVGANNVIQLFSNRSICQKEHPPHSKSIGEMQMSKSKSTVHTWQQISHEEGSSLRYIDFNIIKHLGQGSFGEVILAQCLKNKKLYALKVFQKKKIILSKQTKFVIAEVNILKQIDHPFIINLHFTFQTPNYIYLGLQYCEGKDLAKHLNQEMTFPDEEVRLYAAEIILALQYIHSLDVIYRDLKPDNIMLGKDGHILLVDFGLSKKTENNFAKTFCGSPAYLSPEMLNKHGVGPESDFFTLGVVIYQFLFGEPPFFSDNIVSLYENIKNGRVKFPRRVDEKTQNFLCRLLEKDPTKRLGSKTIEEIKKHEYFSGLDWAKVLRKEYPSPHRELIDNEEEEMMGPQEKELVNMFHDDFDYSEENSKINRFRNFSFVRQGQFK